MAGVMWRERDGMQQTLPPRLIKKAHGFFSQNDLQVFNYNACMQNTLPFFDSRKQTRVKTVVYCFQLNKALFDEVN